MGHFAKKISKELTNSSLCVNTFAESILDFKNIKTKVLNVIYKDTEDDIVEFLKEYQPYIDTVCKKRQYYLKDESRDCEQFIKMYLCKLYHKRYKYSNFPKVVHSVIKRKAIDFSKSRNQDLKGMINESDYLSEATEGSVIDKYSKDRSINYADTLIEDGQTISTIDDYKEEENYRRDTYDIIKIIGELTETVVDIKEFTQKDKRIISIINECVKRGVCELDVILKLISDNRYKANQEFNFFVKRVKKYIDETKYM